jgi:hypothetical protein
MPTAMMASAWLAAESTWPSSRFGAAECVRLPAIRASSAAPPQKDATSTLLFPADDFEPKIFSFV